MYTHSFRTSKHMMENLTELKGEIDKSTITAGYFNSLVFT